MRRILIYIPKHSVQTCRLTLQKIIISINIHVRAINWVSQLSTAADADKSLKHYRYPMQTSHWNTINIQWRQVIKTLQISFFVRSWCNCNIQFTIQPVQGTLTTTYSWTHFPTNYNLPCNRREYQRSILSPQACVSKYNSPETHLFLPSFPCPQIILAHLICIFDVSFN